MDNGERDEVIDSYLELQFQRNPGLVYCITCKRFITDNDNVPDTYHQDHTIARSAKEITSKQVIARLRGV